ncbi:MAG: hypothetical protein ABIQ27_04205 [Flavobacterium sp.]|uniref:IS66 family insertion sequence element accessory protein TnpA n=1 Tax=Flavobacterium sp. TaxID=239 RepID=UPI003263DF4B
MSEQKPNRFRSREEVEELINEWKASGIGKKEFCNRKGLNYQTFVSWFYLRLKKSKSHKSFVPIKIENISSGIFAEIQMGSSRKIIFHQPVGIEFLQALLKC